MRDRWFTFVDSHFNDLGRTSLCDSPSRVLRLDRWRAEVGSARPALGQGSSTRGETSSHVGRQRLGHDVGTCRGGKGKSSDEEVVARDAPQP